MKLQLTGIILLDSSFRHTVDPLPLPPTPHPPMQVQQEIELLRGEVANTYAVKLRVNLDAPEAKYALTIGYAILLTIDLEGAEPPEDMVHRIMVTGANIAFPYCREIVSNLTSRGRFGTVWLNPMNFSESIKLARDESTAAAKQ
jgi:preprotein translocase subunit SecB